MVHKWKDARLIRVVLLDRDMEKERGMEGEYGK